jgi:tRNA pseudouridine55 synthase
LTEYVQQMAKTYRAGLLLGARSDTDDADGTVSSVAGAVAPDAGMLGRCVQEFVGAIEQVPPAYSAAKVVGRRAYDLARQGEEVVLQPRRVHVYAIDMLGYEYPRLELEVRCGKGTYVRSLARDLGERLGCGALVQTLRRTRVGPFDAAAAIPLEADAATARARLLPLAAAVSELPRINLKAVEVARLRQGQAVPLHASPSEMPPPADQEVAVFDPSGSLAAVARVDPARRVLVPFKVLSCC